MTAFTITYDQCDRIMALLDDLARQTYPPQLVEMIVLDDGSRDGTAEHIAACAGELPYRLRLLRRRHDADYLSARRWNECLAAADTRSTVFVQLDDVRVREDLIARHVGWHTDGRVRVVTGAKFDADNETWDLAACARGHLAAPGGGARVIEQWTAVWGASLSYPCTLVERLRVEPHELPFDELMTGWGFHEVEFAYRAVRAGAALVYDPAVGVFHRRHGTIADRGRRVDHARNRDRDGDRNAEYVRAKHRLEALPRW